MSESTSSQTDEHLIVLHQGAIGDFLLALSVIQPVRRQIGARRVIAIAGAPSAKLAAGRSAVDVWRSPDDVGLHTLFRANDILDDRLSDLLASATVVLSFLTDASDPVHRRLRDASAGDVVSIDPRPCEETLRQRQHITRQWCAAIRKAGIAIREPEPPVIRLDTGRGGIVIHPGSGAPGKCWPMRRFCDLADSLHEPVTWMLGPAETESKQRFAAVHERATTGPDSLVSEPELSDAARHIASARLFIGNDAGTTHLAAALRVPTIAIFGPTDPNVWRPLAHHVNIVTPSDGSDSIEKVTISQLKEVIHQMNTPSRF